MKNYLNYFVILLFLFTVENCARKGGILEEREKIVSGDFHNCILFKSSGEVKCWGWGADGQLGQGNIGNLGDDPGEMNDIPPINLGAGRTAKDIFAGGNTTCSLLDDDSLKCWGSNSSGQLGQDSTDDQGDDPGEMAALPAINLGVGRTVKTVAVANTGFHVCAILDDDSVKCWGDNGYGQLGLGDNIDKGDTPGDMGALLSVNLGSGRTAKKIFTGRYHTCVILTDDAAMCWGSNNRGQLGLNAATSIGGTSITNNQGDNPREVASIPTIMLGQRVRTISLGEEFACALLFDGSLKCWGDNNFGQLGLGDSDHRGDSAGEIAALQTVNLEQKVKVIHAGHSFACALLNNNTMKCWGWNFRGQLGLNAPVGGGLITEDLGDDPGEIETRPPVDLGTNEKVWLSFSSGAQHNCAILESYALKCWGQNNNGQLGLEDTTNRGNFSGQMGDNLAKIELLAL